MTSLAVHRWPGPAPAPTDGLLAILVETGIGAPAGAASQREVQRRLIRQAAHQTLAAILDVPADDIAIARAPGAPPHILLANRQTAIGISFSHDGRYSLAAINLPGPIGADIMRVQDIPDWHAVARDYLGAAATAHVQGASDRARAFANAWTRREAALKCHAQELSEWQADLPGSAIALILPDPKLVGHLHIGDKNA